MAHETLLLQIFLLLTTYSCINIFQSLPNSKIFYLSSDWFYSLLSQPIVNHLNFDWFSQFTREPITCHLNSHWLLSLLSQPIGCALLLLTNSSGVWLQVQAVDQDLYLRPEGQVRYRLNGDGANSHFSINEVTGEVKVAQLLDREHR